MTIYNPNGKGRDLSDIQCTFEKSYRLSWSKDSVSARGVNPREPNRHSWFNVYTYWIRHLAPTLGQLSCFASNKHGVDIQTNILNVQRCLLVFFCESMCLLQKRKNTSKTLHIKIVVMNINSVFIKAKQWIVAMLAQMFFISISTLNQEFPLVLEGVTSSGHYLYSNESHRLSPNVDMTCQDKSRPCVDCNSLKRFRSGFAICKRYYE